MNNQYEDTFAKITKRMAEKIDREYLENELKKHKVYLTGRTIGRTQLSTNCSDPKVTTTYVINLSGTATYTSTTEFIYNEPEKKIADPKLQRVLERNYELARCRHDVKQMRRLEKQMHANYK